MTTKEAIQAMLDGKKVRLPEWDEDEYVFIADDGHIRDEKERLFEFKNKNNYEIYEEPKPKQKITIEKWLIKRLGYLMPYYMIVETSEINNYIKDWNDDLTKVKLLSSYELELD